MRKAINWFINLCAFWIILAYIIGYFRPEAFLWFSKGKWMTGALALVMLCMGLSLKLSDFTELFKQPKCVVLAALSQYTVMPLAGLAIAVALRMPPELAVGFIIVATCPGGMASNLIAYIGRASLSLSVVSTAISTMLGIVMTPLLTRILAGSFVEVNVWAMLLNVAEMVLLPVSLGIFINWRFPDAATLLHGIGFGLGYTLGRAFGYSRAIAKSISCETGMQNGGLAVTLARNNFPSYMPTICLPSVFCSIMQSAIGGVLASIWRITSNPGNDEEKQKDSHAA